MDQRQERGFTLIEVVLAIAVGLIIIAGVSVGYTYAKRAAIMDNQRKNVAAMRTYIEQAIASSQAGIANGSTQSGCTSGNICPPVITAAQLAALAQSLPSLKTDPYNGQARQQGCGAATSCFDGEATVGAATTTAGPRIDTISGVAGWGNGNGSAVVYVPGNSFQRQFNLTLADGSTRTFFGYFVAESDADGNIVAAEGGDTSTQQIGGTGT